MKDHKAYSAAYDAVDSHQAEKAYESWLRIREALRQERWYERIEPTAWVAVAVACCCASFLLGCVLGGMVG